MNQTWQADPSEPSVTEERLVRVDTGPFTILFGAQQVLRIDDRKPGDNRPAEFVLNLETVFGLPPRLTDRPRRVSLICQGETLSLLTHSVSFLSVSTSMRQPLPKMLQRLTTNLGVESIIRLEEGFGLLINAQELLKIAHAVGSTPSKGESHE